ncbi:MAG: 5-(carboxyamino)imidazole ribonucleotide mutase [Candidatus Marinimicrobia bacterium]|nr:5-(carboxyamino)imidazole ribonucleotide mutase [Candidatus Neomarinimicrobiota bacterium]RKY57331.1 MAG: 5-(carboxyamino)imidazole ribonucleotide mutase [Candidatus Neomarinimicrobiota bacterium]
MKIAIIVGSTSDLEIIESAKPYLQYFNLDHDIQVLSAHRQHAQLLDYLKKAEEDGVEVIIACAGMAAHLPGVVAAITTLPVIGVPLDASSLNGMDALLSIVQMPKGIPVATMAVGKAGVINAVVYAARILALNKPYLKEKLEEFHKQGSKI